MTEKIPDSTMFPEKAIDTAATVNANVYVPSMPATEISAKCIVGNLTIQPEITSARTSTVAEKASAEVFCKENFPAAETERKDDVNLLFALHKSE